MSSTSLQDLDLLSVPFSFVPPRDACATLSCQSTVPLTANHPITPLHERKVKRGFRSLSTPRICGVVSVGHPVWLWSLRICDWSEIRIPRSCETDLRRNYTTTWQQWKSKFVIADPVTVGRIDSGAIVWFLSGPSCLLSKFSPCSDSTIIIRLLLTEGRRPPKDLRVSSVQWFSLAHSRAGGVTTSRGLFGLSGLPPDSFPPDLKRTIGHVLKHSIRPKPCSLNMKQPHLMTSDLLPISNVTLPVVYPTHFSHTGWGMRALSDAELAAAFEIPSFIPWQAVYATGIVPTQITRLVIERILTHLPASHPSEVPERVVRQRIQASDANNTAIADEEWLPDLQCYLPGSWTDTSISDRAVKADGASIDFFPWHQRISLVLPCSNHTLEVFERFAMRRWRLSIVRSFFSYLATAYGRQWLELLRASAPTTVASPSDKDRYYSRKRRRGLNGAPVGATGAPDGARGGYGFFKNPNLSVPLPLQVNCAEISVVAYGFSVKSSCQHGGNGRPVPLFSSGDGTDRSKPKLLEMACISFLSPK